MATKKITDLQLRDSVTDDLNLPGDDGIQTYRVTGAQIKSYVLSEGAVGATQLATDAVQTAKIQNGAVTSAKAAFTMPTIQRFTSGSGTYTTPAGVKWIRVKMVGGGGGGQAGWTSTWAPAGGTGGSSTFGTSLLTAAGGVGGNINGGDGGAVTVNSPAINVNSQAGSYGATGQVKSSGFELAAGIGGAGFFGGGVPGTIGTNVGITGKTNSGSGGGGGSIGSGSSGTVGAGGGAGGYVEAIITNPSSTYSYAVGAGGTAGTGGSYNGGAGGSGIIVVEEYYQ